MINNCDQLYWSYYIKGYHFHYLTWLLHSCKFCLVFSLSLSIFYLLHVMTNKMYLFHHTNFLREFVIMCSFCSSVCNILMPTNTFFIGRYMKTKPIMYRLSAVAAVRTSTFLVWCLFKRGVMLNVTMFFFYPRKGKAWPFWTKHCLYLKKFLLSL